MHCIFILQLSNNCSGKNRSLGRSTFLLAACSWKVAVLKSDTLTWACVILSHGGCEAVTLWWVLSVSLLIPNIWRHPFPVCYPSAHSPELSKHFGGCAKLECKQAVAPDRKMLWLGMKALIVWYVWHHSIMMLIACWCSLPKLLELDVQRAAWQRGGLFTHLRWCWNGDKTVT